MEYGFSLRSRVYLRLSEVGEFLVELGCRVMGLGHKPLNELLFDPRTLGSSFTLANQMANAENDKDDGNEKPDLKN